ncbi:MAG: RNA methyltransferase [Gammaproteobacteria bacterium]
MKFNIIDNIRIVLVGTTHPGNIGATARAMKTMRLKNLYLVRPKIFPSAESTARATGADDILANAKVFDSLTAAVADCSSVIATSARERSIPWPALDPRACATDIVNTARENPVAFVFGRESSGLSNDELELCNSVVQIPTNTGYSSLNIASAVQIICYEIMRACDEPAVSGVVSADQAPLADHDQMQKLYQHLEQCMIDIGFLDPEKPRRLMRRMKRLFNRAQLDQNEMSILRGFLAAVQEIVRSDNGRK